MAKRLDVAEILSTSVSNLNTPAMQVVEIPLDKLLDNEGNFFRVEDVQELADDIEMRGLENPLTVCEAENGCYRIVAGHRRRKALEQIGKPSAPCIIKSYADADSEEVALIQSNLTARELTYYEKMLAVVRLEEALRRMKENGVELPGRLRDHLAEKSGESASAVHRMTYIYKHLSPELMEGLRQEKINESIAYELANSPKAVQKEFEQRLARGETFRAQDVKKVRNKPTVDDATVNAFLLEWVVRSHDAEVYRVLHANNSPAIMLVHPVKEALCFYGYAGHSGDSTLFNLTGTELSISKPFRAVLSWSQIVSRLRDMVREGKIKPGEEPELTPEEQAVQEFADGMQKAVQDSQPAAPSIPEKDFKMLDKIIAAGKENRLPCAAWFTSDVRPPDGARIIAQDKDGYCEEAQFLGGELDDYSVVSWDEVVRWTLHPADEAYTAPVPQPAPSWHPYPAEKPDEGQMVLALSHSKYNRDNYAAYIFRAGGWYLPELPEDGLVTPDVRWWSAELAPETHNG